MIHHTKKVMSTILGLIFVINGLIITPIGLADNNTDEIPSQQIIETIHISRFLTKIIDDKTTVELPDANGWTLIPGEIKLPTITKIYEFPIGTTILDISTTVQESEPVSLERDLCRNPLFRDINGVKTIQPSNQYQIQSQEETYYPNTYHNYHTGVGLNKENKRVLFVSLTLYPIRYNRQTEELCPIEQVDITIDYKPSNPIMESIVAEEQYDLVIITPQTYVNTMTPFIEHKNQYGLHVLVKSLNDIYSSYQGRDSAEQVKYFVKDCVEDYNTLYVLLIGDIKQCPMRSTDAYPWNGYHGIGILTDLYYADIYNSDMSFSTWDGNQNGIFGEADFHGFPPQPDDNVDDVDLYADVHVGRIPCSTTEELITVIEKIMVYEIVTYDQIWFQKIILAGGDTFGISKGSPFFVYEGEITNTKVGQQLPEFEQIRLWASKRNLHAWTFNRAISKGAGFVSYAGHGFEHGWGTYRPNAIIDSALILYYTPFLNQLKNQHKLPIIFFDACLTAKLDFNITDLIGYYTITAGIANIFLRFTADDHFPSFAWAFLRLEGGGCVANVGATRPAYTYVDKDGVYAGAGYLDVHFFKAYEEGIRVGEMLTHSQLDYLNYVGKDFFTIEEYMFLGDPSLMVGGYP